MKKRDNNTLNDNIDELDESFFMSAKSGLQGLSELIGENNLLRIHKRGRPRKNNAKQNITLRLDPDVIIGLKAMGDGWQVRANAALSEMIQREKDN